MREIKIRTTWIEYASRGLTGIDAPLVREIGFLQLRMNCELIALACLVAHGDIEATKAAIFQTTFSADDIIKRLDSLNSTSFPTPHVVETTNSGQHHFGPRPNDDWMTKQELLDLYGRQCGQVLHKGSMKNLLKPRPPIEKKFLDVLAPAQRMMNLLSIHRIELQDGKLQFVCLLGGFEDDVRTVFATAT